MNLFRFVALSAVLALGAAGLPGCISAPDYSTTPEITFESLQKIHVDNPPGILDVDTLVFSINYKDGDGDLGLLPEDLRNPPFFQDTVPGAARNPNSFNYFIQPYIKDKTTKTFVRFSNVEDGAYDGVFNFLPLVLSRESSAPIKGVLRYKLPLTLTGLAISPGDELQFDISIMDRALHKSNQITTTSVVLGP